MVRRRLRTIVVAAAASASICLSLIGTPAHAHHVGNDRLTEGHGRSGEPALPTVYPTSRTQLAGLDTARMTSKASSVTFADLGTNDSWARASIRWVASDNSWMLDFRPNPDGTYNFRPGAIETRKYLARSIVRAFAPDEQPDGSVVFSDVDASTSWYRWAAVAVQNGWMTAPEGVFNPDAPVTMAMLHRALVLAVGLAPAAKALNNIHTPDGVRFRVAPNFGTTVLGMLLDLRYNAPTGSESMDVSPPDAMSRAQVAYSLAHATTLPSWAVPNLLGQYKTVQLPHLGPRMRAVVQWGIRYAGYPYVWGGEWGFDKPEPLALGGQPRSGFDCSGLTWWLLRADDGSAWNIHPPRPYNGWSLPQRTSGDMATMAPKRIKYGDLVPGDIMFYDGAGDGVIDHVDTYIGNGFALDSSSTPGGVSIMWVGNSHGLYGSDWYRTHFMWGRRILPH
ncbi:MAG TPA: NlpC/P60 family protein [Actinomycetota bacterium]|nr:NlpC/P60 family protein [Actinomycetota bacterium]